MGRPYFRGVALLAGVLLLGAVGVKSFQYARGAVTAAVPRAVSAFTYADRMGTRYPPVPADLTLAPRVKEIPIEIHVEAIWGSTGRDLSGQVWVCAANRGSGRARPL